MFLAARRIGRRRYKRRASGFKKAVSSIAKKVVMRQSETKTGNSAWTAAFGSNGTFYSVNGGGLWSGIVQGDEQNNRDGDQIRSLGVKIRGRINLDGSLITAGRQYAGFRVLICSGKRPLTSGDMPTYEGPIDPERITVLSDRYYKLTETNWGVQFNQYVKFNRLVRYSGLVAIKNDLYLWVIPVPLGTGLQTSTGYGLSLGMQTYFKDI